MRPISIKTIASHPLGQTRGAFPASPVNLKRTPIILFAGLLTLSLTFQSCDNQGLRDQAQGLEAQLTEAQATIDSLQQLSQEPKTGFIHTVFFWMKEDLTDEQKTDFLAGLKSLEQIETVRSIYIGIPAETPRIMSSTQMKSKPSIELLILRSSFASALPISFGINLSGLSLGPYTVENLRARTLKP